jgi:magnesium transporter
VHSEAQHILETIQGHLDAGDVPALAAYLNTVHPADIAEVIGPLEPEERQQVIDLLDLHEEAEVIEYVDESVRSDIVAELDDRQVSQVAEELPPEEAADLLAELPEDRADHVLELMAGPEAQEVEGLLKYPPETAGGLMAPTLVRVLEDQTVQGLLGDIREATELHEEEIYNIYVVDHETRVLGQVSVWDLLRAQPDTQVRELMEEVHTVPADMDQEEVAGVFRKYDLYSAPVVDARGRLLGRIVFDEIHDVVEDEVTEDISKFAGTDDEELASSSALNTARLRLPWLLVCLGGTFVSGAVIHSYEATLKEVVLLMVFIPAVMATAGNSGLQTASMTIRGLATGYMERVGARAEVLRQLKATALVALACGLVVALVSGLWSSASGGPMLGARAWLLGGVIGGAMFAAICLSATLGVVVPLLFGRIGIDPAVASGPLITTSSDIFSLMVYLGVATMLLVQLKP